MALQNVPPIISQSGITCISTISVFWFLALVFLCLRLYTRFCVRRCVNASDWLLVIAFVVVCGLESITILVSVYGGLGFPAATIDPAYFRNNLKLGLGYQTAHTVALGLVKLSICYLLASIIPRTAFRVAIVVVAVCCVSWSIAGILVAFLTCQPLSLTWTPELPGTCGDFIGAWTAIGALDVITDAALIIAPMPLLHRFKMNNSLKWAVSSIFVLGAATSFIAIIRTATVAHVSLVDVTAGSFWVYLWSGIEAPLAIIVASMLSLRPLCIIAWPPVRDFFGLPMLDSDEQEEEVGYYVTATYNDRESPRRTYRESYDTDRTERTNHLQQHDTYATQRSSTFLDMEENDDDDDNATRVPSMAEMSHPTTPARTKGKKRTVSQEAHELSRNDSIAENGIFSMGATAPLEPEESETGSQAGPSGIFSMGATPALEPEVEEKPKQQKKKKRGWWKG